MAMPSPGFLDDRQMDLPAIDHLPLAELLDRLAVEPERGLSQEQAEERLSRFGSNALPMAAPRATWLKFLDQFKSLLIVVLGVAATLAALVGNLKDAAVIIAVVLFNAALGFYQEHRAEQSLAALRGMLPVKARVRRNGTIAEVGADRLVPGDIVLLEAGDRVPADGRLIQAASVAIDEIISHWRVPAGSEGRWRASAARRSSRRTPEHGLHEHAGDKRTRRDCGDTDSCLYRHGQNFERVGSCQ